MSVVIRNVRLTASFNSQQQKASVTEPNRKAYDWFYLEKKR